MAPSVRLLDLPFDIHLRILSYLRPCNRSILIYSSLFDPPLPITKFLPKTLYVRDPFDISSALYAWVSRMPDLQRLHVSESFGVQESLIPLIQMPSLRYITIPFHETYFEAIVGSDITHLSLWFLDTQSLQEGVSLFPIFINTLGSLRSLTLLKTKEWDDLYQSVCGGTTNLSEPPPSYPTVTHLQICLSSVRLNTILDLIQQFPNIQKLSVRNVSTSTSELTTIPENLKQISTFNVHNAKCFENLVDLCPLKINELSVFTFHLPRTASLANCVNLTVLNVVISETSISTFFSIVPSLVKLRRLGVHYRGSLTVIDCGNSNEEIQQCFLQISSCLPRLANLAFYGFSIAPEIATGVIKRMSTRLRSFSLFLVGQPVSPISFLSTLIFAAIRYSPNVKYICPAIKKEIENNIELQAGIMTLPSVTSEQLSRLEMGIERLRLVSNSFEGIKNIHELIPNVEVAETDEELSGELVDEA